MMVMVRVVVGKERSKGRKKRINQVTKGNVRYIHTAKL